MQVFYFAMVAAQFVIYMIFSCKYKFQWLGENENEKDDRYLVDFGSVHKPLPFHDRLRQRHRLYGWRLPADGA
jgi:hypothetical protein